MKLICDITLVSKIYLISNRFLKVKMWLSLVILKVI